VETPREDQRQCPWITKTRILPTKSHGLIHQFWKGNGPHATPCPGPQRNQLRPGEAQTVIVREKKWRGIEDAASDRDGDGPIQVLTLYDRARQASLSSRRPRKEFGEFSDARLELAPTLHHH